MIKEILKIYRQKDKEAKPERKIYLENLFLLNTLGIKESFLH